MEFDHRTRRSRAATVTAPHALGPGKRTLTEQLPLRRRDARGKPTASENRPSTSGPARAPSTDPRSMLQMLFGVQQAAPEAPVEDPTQVHAAAARGIGSPATKLPYADQIQRLFGRHDISSVQAHVGGKASASAQEMGARAYATGEHVVLGEGADLHTVAHEAAHVVQQRGGVQLKSGVGQVGDAYEQHADAVADRVVRGDSAVDLLAAPPGTTPDGPPKKAACAECGGAPAGTGDCPVCKSLDAPPQAAQSTPTMAARAVQRDCDPSVSSCLPEDPDASSEPNASYPPDASPDENQSVAPDEAPGDAHQQYQTALSSLTGQGAFDPSSNAFAQYCSAYQTLSSEGNGPSEPQGFANPPNQIVVADENGVVQLMTGDIVGIDDALLPVLDQVADASDGSGNLSVGTLGQVLLYDDGRVVSTPPITADLATLLTQGQPMSFSSGLGVNGVDRTWRRVSQAGGHSLLTSGVYQLGTYPLSRFMGATLPPGSRIRFADPSFAGDTRLFTIFERGSKRFFAWDGHAPVGGTPHNFYHVNQKGMFNLFGRSNHANLGPAEIGAARGLRMLRVGGRVFLLVGVAVDAAYLTQSVVQSVEQGTPRPAIAQAIRTVGGWGGAWAGAKLGCAGGAALGVETGPGMALTCLAGGIIGGFGGYFGADWIADMISED